MNRRQLLTGLAAAAVVPHLPMIEIMEKPRFAWRPGGPYQELAAAYDGAAYSSARVAMLDSFERSTVIRARVAAAAQAYFADWSKAQGVAA